MGVARVCGVVDGDEKPRVCGVVDGDEKPRVCGVVEGGEKPRLCGVVEGGEKPRVCGVVEGDEESWPESDFEIRADSRLPPRRPLLSTAISISSCGISVIFWRKSFSKASAIRTISSPGLL